MSATSRSPQSPIGLAERTSISARSSSACSASRPAVSLRSGGNAAFQGRPADAAAWVADRSW